MNRQKKKALLLTAALIVLLGLIALLAGKPLMELLSDADRVRNLVAQYPVVSRAGFVLLAAFQVIVAFIPGEPFEIAAGYAFGSLWGSVLCMSGIVLGSVTVFLSVRRFGMKLVRLFFSEEQISGNRVLQNEDRLDKIAFLVFLLPGTPKDILTYLAGLTRMKLPTWLFICSAARIPSVVSSVICGSAIGSQNYLRAFALLAAVALLSGGGLLLYRRMNAKQS